MIAKSKFLKYWWITGMKIAIEKLVTSSNNRTLAYWSEKKEIELIKNGLLFSLKTKQAEIRSEIEREAKLFLSFLLEWTYFFQILFCLFPITYLLLEKQQVSLCYNCFDFLQLLLVSAHGGNISQYFFGVCKNCYFVYSFCSATFGFN